MPEEAVPEEDIPSQVRRVFASGRCGRLPLVVRLPDPVAGESVRAMLVRGRDVLFADSAEAAYVEAADAAVSAWLPRFVLRMNYATAGRLLGSAVPIKRASREAALNGLLTPVAVPAVVVHTGTGVPAYGQAGDGVVVPDGVVLLVAAGGGGDAVWLRLPEGGLV